MKIYANFQVIEMEFENTDWNYPHGKLPGGAKQLIADLITLIPKEERYVDGETHRFIVLRSKQNEHLVEELKSLYLEAENQIPLFPE